MQDDARADVLFSALAGERQLPGDQEYGELRALADLGARLETLGSAMAAMARAEDAFDPSFAAGLHRTLLAAHPATVQPEPARADSTARTAARAARRISRRMLTLVLMALALAAAVVAAILHGAQQTAPVGTGVLSSTATHVARSVGGVAPHAPSSARGPNSLAPKTPSARTFGPMELRPSPRTRSTASRAGSGAAATQTAPAPSTAGSAHGVAGGSAPNGTPTPGMAKIATAPGLATPTAIPGPSRRSGGPMLGAAGIPSSAGGGVFRYRLPERTPSQPSPSKVSVYRLRLTPTSPAEIKAITATFPGLKPLPGTNGLGFAGPDEQLGITPTTGAIMYTRRVHAGGASPPAPAPNTALALVAARDWLHAHLLFPTHIGPVDTSATTEGIWTTVRIVPALHPALLTGAQIPAITVVLDPRGAVTNAEIRWATAEAAGITALISPSAAMRADEKARTTAAASSARSKQPSPLFIVTRVTLAYQPIAEGVTFVLRPVYLFRGTLEGRPFSQTAAAEAR